MTITTRLAPRYWVKTIVMMVVCFVLGMWGVWDYYVAIPNATEGSNRAEALRVIKNGLDTVKGSNKRLEATVLIDSVLEKIDSTDDVWISNLKIMKDALAGGSIDLQRSAMDLVIQGLNEYGNIVAPSKFDRPMQWIFILCLPFAFYYFLNYLKYKKRASIYQYTKDGTLITPEGSWDATSINDIDMSTWISKTAKARLTWIAKVDVKDHKPIVLDDYTYQDMYLIVGAIASQFYPNDWDQEAKRIQNLNEDESSGQ